MAKKVKVKTHSGAKKRFKITSSGKAIYKKTNKSHRLTQKETKRKRLARGAGVVSDANIKQLKKMVPYL